MKRPPARELLLMCAPLALFALVAIYAARPEPQLPAPKKWRIETQITRRAPLPYEVRRGIDTCLRVKIDVLSPNGPPMGNIGSLWNDARLISIDEMGHETRIWDSNWFRQKNYERFRKLSFGGGGGGNAEEWQRNYNFALRRFPNPSHRIELRVDSVWRPVQTKDMSYDATPGEVAWMKSYPDALFLSKRLVLRDLGEKTPIPIVSRDPMFDVRRVEVRPIAGYSPSETDLQVRWHVFWRGPIIKRDDFWYCPKDVRVVDEKNYDFGNDNNSMHHPDAVTGRRFPVWHRQDFQWLRQTARERGSKKLFLRGWISVQGRWPREVNVPLPDWVLNGPIPKIK